MARVATASAAAAAKVIAACLLLSVCLHSGETHASAINVWEFFTRNEQLSYLYSTFAQLVSAHCKATAASTHVPVNQCKRNLLAYGYERLQTFTDWELNGLDPHQRDANEFIWSAIMRDHASATLVSTRQQPLPTPPASSIVILTPQKDVATPLAASTPIRPNPLFVDAGAELERKKQVYAMDMDIAYGYNPGQQQQHPQQQQSTAGVRVNAAAPGVGPAATGSTTTTTYLTGPLVIRVRPDGTPVAEDQYRTLPRNVDDLEPYQLGGGSSSSASSSTPNPAGPSATGRQNKHRKIASISALKQQHLATLALQQQLQPPYAQARYRRQYQAAAVAAHQQQHQQQSAGYHYGKGQP